MKNIKIIFFRVVIALSLGLFASCYVGVVATYPSGAVIVAPGPPPFFGAVWIGGEYRWDGHRYVEVGGHWARAPRGRTWVRGGWRPVRGGYAWTRGHWR
jgi:hypothetical protein